MYRSKIVVPQVKDQTPIMRVTNTCRYKQKTVIMYFRTGQLHKVGGKPQEVDLLVAPKPIAHGRLRLGAKALCTNLDGNCAKLKPDKVCQI